MGTVKESCESRKRGMCAVMQQVLNSNVIMMINIDIYLLHIISFSSLLCINSNGIISSPNVSVLSVPYIPD